MNNNVDTYIKLFKLDINGIGDLELLNELNVDDARTAWANKAIELFFKEYLTVDEEEFYYDFVEKYMKKNFNIVENPSFNAFKNLYFQQLFDIIEKDYKVAYGQGNFPNNKFSNLRAFEMKNKTMTRQTALEELTLCLVNSSLINNDKIKLDYGTIKQNKNNTNFLKFNAKNNEIIIDRSKMVSFASHVARESSNPINDCLEKAFEILVEIAKQNNVNHMNHELTLKALHYNIEKNYKRAFKSKAFDYMINVPSIEHDSKKYLVKYLKNVEVLKKLDQSSLISTFLNEKSSLVSNELHYSPIAKQDYGVYADSKDMIAEEVVTRSLISIRANPKSLPTNIKRTLFIDGELKTLYKLKQDLESLKNTKGAMTMEYHLKKVHELEALIDYLVTYSIPTKIENIAILYNELDNEYKAQLTTDLMNLRYDYPTEYNTTLAILKNRLNKLNSYSASSTHASSYLDEILHTQQNYDVLVNIPEYPSRIMTSNLVNVTLKSKEVNPTPDVIYSLQKLTGMGVKDVLDSINRQEDILLLHDIPEALAKHYTNNKALKKKVDIR